MKKKEEEEDILRDLLKILGWSKSTGGNNVPTIIIINII